MLAKAEKALLETTEKTGEWNLYEILAEGNRTRLMLNVVTTVAYTEADSSTEQEGLIGLQIQS